jgi:BRCA1-associated protein
MVPVPARQERRPSAESSASTAGVEVGAGGFAAKGKFLPLEGDNLELGYGVVHLFRDAEPTPGLYGDNETDSARAGSRRATAERHGNKRQSRGKQEDCATLCILAVPYYVTPLDFLGFVGEKTREEVSHFRMVRTERVNRYMVLMKFRDAKKAREWRQEWNGKAFNGMEVSFLLCFYLRCLRQHLTIAQPEYCHVVFVKSIQLQTPDGGDDSSTYPSLTNDPLTPQSSTKAEAQGSAVTSSKLPPSSLSKKPVAPPTPSLVELPTCPVCLERMDETTGLLTILCQHVFHCACLQRWRGSGCPVCRYTQGGETEASWVLGKPERKLEEEACGVCGSDSNLWVW